MESLFIQMMYKSQFQKIDPYDWFCGPGSHLFFAHQKLKLKTHHPDRSNCVCVCVCKAAEQ